MLMLTSRCVSFARLTIPGLLLLVGPVRALADRGDAFPSCKPLADRAEADFTDSTAIVGDWFPLIPGTQFILQGFADRGGGVLPHTVTFTVTDRTLAIDGVETLAVLDEDVNEGQLVEEELAFVAADADENVWSFGEYPEERDAETGEIVTPSVWFAGEGEGEKAQAGVLVPGDPSRGTNWYLQGWSADIEFLDCAKVVKTELTLSNDNCKRGVCKHVMVEEERSPLAHEGGEQYKYYAPGVGLVQVGAVGDKENETLVLIAKRQITGTREWRQIGKEVDRLFDNACGRGFEVLCR